MGQTFAAAGFDKMPRIAVLNAGTATLKLAVLRVEGGEVTEEHRSQHEWTEAMGPGTITAALTGMRGERVDAVGHRVVHGGSSFVEGVRLDGAVVDAIAFGGGIGTYSSEIRRRVAAELAAWDIAIDMQLNAANAPGRISKEGSRGVFALRTDEESIIAREIERLLANGAPRPCESREDCS